MTVKEMIEKLKEFPEEMEIKVADTTGFTKWIDIYQRHEGIVVIEGI